MNDAHHAMPATEAITPAEYAGAADFPPPAQKEPSGENQMIPLSLLAVSEDNVRKLKPGGIAGLAANIQAYGILQNLLVTPTESGYGIVAGKRRFLALSMLAKAKRIEGDHLVPCKVVSSDNLTALSLTENDQRESMHPADEYTAWAKLRESGMSLEEISANNGISPLVIKRRLRLASASPKLFKLFRKDKLSLAMLMAFCATDDTKLQESVYNKLGEYDHNPQAVRRYITSSAVAGDSPIALFVGKTLYQKEGGTLTADLFSEDQGPNAISFNDSALLERLFTEKAQAVADQYAAQGWKWINASQDQHSTSDMAYRISPTRRKATKAEQTAIEDKAAQIRELSEKMNDDDLTDEDYEKLDQAYDRAQAEATQLNDALDKFTKKQMAVSGVILRLNQYGELSPSYGWVTYDDEQAARALNKPTARDDENESPEESENAHGSHEAGDSDANGPSPDGSLQYSEPLCNRLSAWRTVMLRDALTADPALAKRFMLIKLAQSANLIDYMQRSESADVLEMNARCSPEMAEHAPDLIGSKLYQSVQKTTDQWMQVFADLSGEQASQTILDMDEQRADELLAFIVGLTVNASTGKTVPENKQPGQAIANAASLTAAKHWKPTAQSYFSHLTRAQIADTVTQFAPDKVSSLKSLNKKATAEAAEKAVAGTDWMPIFMQS